MPVALFARAWQDVCLVRLVQSLPRLVCAYSTPIRCVGRLLLAALRVHPSPCGGDPSRPLARFARSTMKNAWAAPARRPHNMHVPDAANCRALVVGIVLAFHTSYQSKTPRTCARSHPPTFITDITPLHHLLLLSHAARGDRHIGCSHGGRGADEHVQAPGRVARRTSCRVPPCH